MHQSLLMIRGLCLTESLISFTLSVIDRLLSLTASSGMNYFVFFALMADQAE